VRQFQRHVALRPVIGAGRAPHLAHAAFAQARDQHIRADSIAGGEILAGECRGFQERGGLGIVGAQQHRRQKRAQTRIVTGQRCEPVREFGLRQADPLIEKGGKTRPVFRWARKIGHGLCGYVSEVG
jgi:hypothetical protein